MLGPPPPRQRLRAAQRRLREQGQLRQAQRLERVAQLRESSVFGPTALDWVSAYSLLLDRFRSEPYALNVTSAYDHKHGRNFPIYQSEAELSLLRAPSRVLCQTNTYAQGLVEGLTSYVIGTGYTYRAVPLDGKNPPPALVDALQALVDSFLLRNDWNNHDGWGELDGLPQQSLEEEFFARSLRDGETTLLHTATEDGQTDVRIVEPEFIVQPGHWPWTEGSFGWLTPPNDEQKKLAAWISFTGNPADGDEYSVEVLSQLRRNSDRIAKRGVPDFAFDAYDALQLGQRLRRALATGGAQKASIAIVRQHKATTQDQVTTFQQPLADTQQVDLVTGQVMNRQLFNPGGIEDIPENLEYVDGPSTANEAALVEVLAACLRGAVVRWNGFEWLVSADASSNSYANALAAKSPAVMRVRREQARYRACFLRSISIAVFNACEAGALRAAGRTWSWDEVRALCEVQVEAPSPEVEDPLQKAQENQTYVGIGAKSVQTVQQELGLDSEREAQNIEEWQAKFGPQPGALGLPGEEEGKPKQGEDRPQGKTQSNPPVAQPKVKLPTIEADRPDDAREAVEEMRHAGRALGEALRGLAARPLLEAQQHAQPPTPITALAPTFNLHLADAAGAILREAVSAIEVPAPQIVVNVPPAEVTVNVPPAEVTVNVPAQAPPVVNVQPAAPVAQSEGSRTVTFTRDEHGRITSAEVSGN